jgi:cofilin
MRLVCVSAFNNVKLNRSVFVVHKIDPSTSTVMIETQGDLNQGHSDFIAALSDTECRYAFYELTFRTGEDNNRPKLFFIVWTPDKAGIRVSLSATSVSTINCTQDS